MGPTLDVAQADTVIQYDPLPLGLLRRPRPNGAVSKRQAERQHSQRQNDHPCHAISVLRAFAEPLPSGHCSADGACELCLSRTGP